MSLTHTPAWHTAQATEERAWLDQWARLHNTTALERKPATEAPALLTTAGSPQ